MDITADYSKTSIIGWANQNRPHQNDSPQSHAAFLHTLAYNILRSVCQERTLRSGKPSYTHPLHLSQQDDLTPKQRIIALLHDVLEDSIKNDDEHKWTADDLRAIGFPEDIVLPIIAVTRQDGEPYFDFIQRVARDGGEDGIVVKMLDLRHNSQNERYAHLMPSSEVDRFDKYNVCYYYLHAVQQGSLPDQTILSTVDASVPFPVFMDRTPQYADHPHRCNELLDLFSSSPMRLQEPDLDIFKEHLKQSFKTANSKLHQPYSLSELVNIGTQPPAVMHDAYQNILAAQDNTRRIGFIRGDKHNYTHHMNANNICGYYLAARLDIQTGSTIEPIDAGTPLQSFLNSIDYYDLAEPNLSNIPHTKPEKTVQHTLH